MWIARCEEEDEKKVQETDSVEIYVFDSRNVWAQKAFSVGAPFL